MALEPRIRISPQEMPIPRLSRIPRLRGRRWRSHFETAAADDAPADMRPGVSIFVTQRAFVRCCAHAASDLRNEVGGALIGKWRADPQTGEQFIVVEAALAARHTRHSNVHLTFTQDSLVALHGEREARYPDKAIVGWYHTHPRMGVFLSGYDLWLHEHFFPEVWQVAMVIEPHSSTGGFFVRQPEARLDPQRYFGFYELAADGRRSVMHWTNLRLEETDIGENDGGDHE